MIRVTVDAGRLPAQLKRLEEALRNRWWQGFAPRAQLLIEREQRRHFSEQEGPGGEKWAPLSPLTLELSAAAASEAVGGATRFSKRKGGGWTAHGPGGEQKIAVVRRTANSKILIDTGLLQRSITQAGSKGSVRNHGPNWLEVGTNVKYAERLHFGGVFPVTDEQRALFTRLLGRPFTGKKITIPARPFLGMSQRGRMDLQRGARSDLQKLLRSIGK